MVGPQAVILDKIYSIHRVVKLTDQLAGAKKDFLIHDKENEIETAQSNNLAFQRLLLQRKAADTLARTSGDVLSLSGSLKKADDEVCKVSE